MLLPPSLLYSGLYIHLFQRSEREKNRSVYKYNKLLLAPRTYTPTPDFTYLHAIISVEPG